MTQEGVKYLDRFDLSERIVHWLSALFMIVCIATAIALKIPPIMVKLGGRTPIRITHIISGLLLPLPILLAIILPRSGRNLRKDLKILNRWSNEDKRWLRSWGSAKGLWSGKFNGGQKANSAFIGGLIIVMLMTGIVMASYNAFPLDWRTGATFVHNVFALLGIIAISGHIGYAVMERSSLHAMIFGTVNRNWAKKHAPSWVDELEGTSSKLPSDEDAFVAEMIKQGLIKEKLN